METIERVGRHLPAFGGRKLDPALEQACDAGGRVGLHQAGAVGGNLRGDVHLVREQHGPAAGQCFGCRDAEVFLVRWQRKGLRRTKCAPLGVSQQHPRPVDSLGHPSRLGWALQLSAPVLRVWAGHDQIEGRLSRAPASRTHRSADRSLFCDRSARERGESAGRAPPGRPRRTPPAAVRVARRRNRAEGTT